MEIHYADEVYRAQDDISDPFRWSRFGNARFVLTGLALVLLLIFAAGQNPRASVAGQGVEVGSHVASDAVRLALRIAR